MFLTDTDFARGRRAAGDLGEHQPAVASALGALPPPCGLSSLMPVVAGLSVSSLTYRLPVVTSCATSNGCLKPVKPVIPAIGSETVPPAVTLNATISWLAL